MSRGPGESRARCTGPKLASSGLHMYRGCYFFLVHHLHLERCASPAVHVSPPPRGSITRCCTRATGSFSTPFASQTEIFGCFAIFSSQFARGEAKHLAKEPRVIAQIENDGATACACGSAEHPGALCTISRVYFGATGSSWAFWRPLTIVYGRGVGDLVCEYHPEITILSPTRKSGIQLLPRTW